MLFVEEAIGGSAFLQELKKLVLTDATAHCRERIKEKSNNPNEIKERGEMIFCTLSNGKKGTGITGKIRELSHGNKGTPIDVILAAIPNGNKGTGITGKIRELSHGNKGTG